MTQREFLSKIISKQGMDSDIIETAKAYLTKLDARNETRRNTPTKEQLANAPIKDSILNALKERPMVASAIATKCGVSTQKVSALCKQLVEDGLVSVKDIHIKNKGSVKEYSLVEEE